MEFVQEHILTLILLTPALGGLVIMLLPKGEVKLVRWAALLLSLVPLALSVWLWLAYDSAQPGFQFQEQAAWFPTISATYHVGVDGISVPMILLTTLLAAASILASWSIDKNVRGFMALFLLLETGMLGVFMALDLWMFFLFWEVGLVPMYFLINQWGSEKGERDIGGGRTMPARTYASFKFLIYTMAGSLGFLLAIQLIGVAAGTFDLVQIFNTWGGMQAGQTLPNLPIAIPLGTVKTLAFWAFVIAFAIKVPVWPFHTWLPDAHTEAPTAGSMILAGVLLKLGAYGFLRLVLPLYPAEARAYAGVLALLATAGIIFGALSSWAQNDFKRLVAYSSVNHMGFVVLAIATAALAQGTVASQSVVIAVNGAVLQMFNHGLSAAGMFFLVGVLYERTHTRDLKAYGGLFPLAPVYGGILIFTAMASLGLPGLNGFVSEFMVVRGAWPVFTLFTALSMIGLFFTGAYILKGIRQVLHGQLNEAWKGHALEINRREILTMVPLLVLILAIGVWPSWIVSVINGTVTRLFGG
jgi:NADH-quinone oxidoreductase subunit M